MTGTGLSHFEYDVALSFLYQDEGDATRLNELMKPRLKTFIYTEHQKKLAGRDGEQLFSDVFGKESRLVAILYRDDWGQTKWTRIEQTAIRNRGHEYGYDFVILIPMARGITPPIWFPKNRIWLGLEQWGFEAAAIVIDSRVQELDGEIHDESVEDKIARLAEIRKKSSARQSFRSSERGVSSAKTSFAALVNALRTAAEATAAAMRFEVKDGTNTVVVIGQKLGLSAELHVKYTNSLDHLTLTCAIWDGHPPKLRARSIYDDERRKLGEDVYEYDFDGDSVEGWRLTETLPIIAPDLLAEKMIKRLLDEQIKAT